MYDFVRGVVRAREPAACVVEAGGIGYAVSVPLSTSEKLPAAGGATLLYLHLVVREDQWRLFGFATEEERRVFRKCLDVPGVGPVTALALLSGMKPRELAAAVQARDVKALTRVKGVGKKTAERLVIELKDAFEGLEGSGTAAPPPGPFGDALRALTALGLTPEEAETRLRRVQGVHGSASGEAATVGDLVRRALKGG